MKHSWVTVITRKSSKTSFLPSYQNYIWPLWTICAKTKICIIEREKNSILIHSEICSKIGRTGSGEGESGWATCCCYIAVQSAVFVSVFISVFVFVFSFFICSKIGGTESGEGKSGWATCSCYIAVQSAVFVSVLISVFVSLFVFVSFL